MVRLITIIGYLICIGVAVTVEIASRRQRDKTIPLGTLLDRVMVSRPIRITILAFWWWLGWHFLVTT